MGLYNNKNLPSPLQNNRCLICNHDITPTNVNSELDAFEYKCKNCNQDLIIQISGSLLADNLLYELKDEKNHNILKLIKEAIGLSENKSFMITTSIARQYLNYFSLTDKSPIQEFLLEHSYSLINLKRIDIKSLRNQGENTNSGEWLKELIEMKPKLSLNSYNSRGFNQSFSINLYSLISPYNKIPIIEFNSNEFFAPSENINNYSDSSKNYENLSVKLEWDHNYGKKIEIFVFYDSTIGVKKI